MRQLVVVAAVLVVLVGCSSSPVPRRPTLGAIHDVFDGDIGDPFVLSTPTGYVMFGTDDPPDHVPTATSPDHVHWVRGQDAVPALPAWADPDPFDRYTWAPAAVFVAGQYRLYVAVQDTAVHRECIAVLTSAAALGPYRDGRGSPLVCQPALGGSIDPSVVTDGGLHLVWKSDGNCCGLPSELWEQDLTADGLAVTGSAHALLRADRSWQGGIIENPAMLRAGGGGWWLFYSGNAFNVAAYGTGLAWCRTVSGPCRETTSGPFLATAAGQFSPGGLEVFHDHAGALWVAFATWNRPARRGRFFCCRSVDTAPLMTR